MSFYTRLFESHWCAMMSHQIIFRLMDKTRDLISVKEYIPLVGEYSDDGNLV